MHLDEKRELRISHHIKAIEALTSNGVLALVFTDKDGCLSLALTLPLEGADKQAAFLGITDLCVGLAIAQVVPEST